MRWAAGLEEASRARDVQQAAAPAARARAAAAARAARTGLLKVVHPRRRTREEAARALGHVGGVAERGEARVDR